MKTIIKFTFLLSTIVLAFGMPFAVLAQAPVLADTSVINGDQTIFDNSFTLTSGQILNGNLTVFNGATTLAEGSTVNGDVYIIDGQLSVSGLVNGSLVCTNCTGQITDSAEIRGNLVSASNDLVVSPSAKITNDSRFSLPAILKNLRLDEWVNQVSVQKPQTSLTQKVLWNVFLVLAISALSVLVALLFPKATAKVADAVAGQPAPSFGVGVLTVVALPIIMLIMTITVILIPLVIFLGLGVVAAMIFGWVALSLEVGNRLSSASTQKWHEAISAGVGSLLVGFILALVSWIPFLGFVVLTLVALFGLGAVVFSIFSKLTPVKTAPVPPALTISPVAPVIPAALKKPQEEKKPAAPIKVAAKPPKIAKK
jgi:hypothetical protein